MKRLLLVLITVIITTTVSFAGPGPWKVKVTWQVTSSSTCQFQDLVNDRFLVTITIVDNANNVTVVNNLSQIESNDATSSTFDVQQALEAYCNDTSSTFVPAFEIYTAVRMVNIQTQYVYCMEKDPGTLTDCQEMSIDGKDIAPILFQ